MPVRPPVSSILEVVVEYERSLNACLAHLRTILGDRADAPRYIETWPRRGYRFIAPVQRWRPFPQPTVAVLPFVNLTSDPAFEYFAAGLTGELITELASISALRVISYQSVLHLKGTSRTLPDIASELGADALIEGSAVCEAERVRLNVQLVAASPERHLWAKAYECARGEVIAFHRQVARAVADTVDASLTPAELDRLSRVPRVDPLAQDAYVRGCYHATMWSEEHSAAALGLFEEAIARDPTYAPAHVAIARILFLLAYWGHLPLKPTLTRAREAAAAALALDKGLASAHTVMAWLHWALDWDFEVRPGVPGLRVRARRPTGRCARPPRRAARPEGGALRPAEAVHPALHRTRRHRPRSRRPRGRVRPAGSHAVRGNGRAAVCEAPGSAPVRGAPGAACGAPPQCLAARAGASSRPPVAEAVRVERLDTSCSMDTPVGR